jgi:hypothetical protein
VVVGRTARLLLAAMLLVIALIVVITPRTGAFAPFGFGDLQRVSLDNSGAQLPLGATNPAVSGNGRFVAFTTAQNIVSSDQNNANDVYVRDTVAGTTTLISFFGGTNGGAGDVSDQAAISNDGRWVAFTSSNSLWSGPEFTQTGVFVVDRGAPAADGSFSAAPGSPVLVSLSAAGTPVTLPADTPSISADGSQIAFHWGEVEGGDFVEVRDRDRNHNGVIAENAGDEATIDVVDGDFAFQPKISSDGRHVAFLSIANAISGGAPRTIVYDRSVDGRASLDKAGNTRFSVVTTTAFNLTDGDGNALADPLLGSISADPDISGNGSIVTYSYSHPMKTPTPAGRLPDTTRQIIAVHRDANGNPVNPIVVSADGSQALDKGAGNQDSVRPVVSMDGRYVDFVSGATNLGLSGTTQNTDCNGATAAGKRCDVYAVDLAAADADRAPVLVSKSADSNNANGTVGDKGSYQVSISGTGQFSAITSNATNFVPPSGDTNNRADVFLREWQPQLSVTFSPQPFTNTPVGGTSGPYTATVDTFDFGPWSASNVTLTGPNTSDFTVTPQSCSQQTFHIGQPCIVAVTFHPTGIGLRDAQLQITLAGHAPTQSFGLIQGVSSMPASPGSTERASLGPTGQISDDSFDGRISANGRYVAFDTNASLDTRDNNGTTDVYVRDRLRNTTTLVSIAPGAANVSTQPSSSPSISGDGRYIAFEMVTVFGTDNTVVPPRPITAPAAVVIDRGPVDGNGDFTGTPALHTVAAQQGVAACEPSISGDGSQVTYWTSTPAAPVPDSVSCSNFNEMRAFVVDEDADANGVPYEGGTDAVTTELLAPNGFNARVPRMSADGLHVAFVADVALVPAEELGPTAPVALAYDRQINGTGAKDSAGNTRYVLVTTGDFTPLTAGDNRAAAIENTRTFSAVPSGNGSTVAYQFDYTTSADPAAARVLSSPFAPQTSEILVARRDAAGALVSTDIASEAGTGPATPGDGGDSNAPDISNDGRYVTFETTARNLLPHDAADCEGPCSVALVADVTAPSHAGGPQLVAPSADPNNTIGGMPEEPQFDTSISGDGRFILFNSSGNDMLPFVSAAAGGGALVSPDTNNHNDVFLRELRPVDPTIPPNVDFGNVPAGQSSSIASVQFTTNDFGPAPILSVSLAGTNPGDFNILGTTGCEPTLPDLPAAPVAPVPNYGIIHLDTPCTVSLNFTPIVDGPSNAVLRVVTGTPFPADNPEGLPVPPGQPPSRITTDVSIHGGGLAISAFKVDPVPLDLGEQTVGVLGAPKPLTVTNIGDLPFGIATVTLTGANPGDFTITSDSCSGASLNAGATCVVQVSFHASGAGDRNAFVQFVDTASGSPQLAPLHGRAPTIIVNPGVVAPSRTVLVTGMSWAANQQVQITMIDTSDPTHQFPETVTVQADGSGTFKKVAVLFPKSPPGSRFVVATSVISDPFPGVTARAPLLVALATSQAPNFLTRG